MNEAALAFNQTVSERSKLKNNTYHKKNGSAVTKLGNKRMSWQEIRSKHGECKTYPSTDDFMDYSLFEELPSDLKIEFVNKMMDKYDISLSQISQFLFNKGGDGLKANLRNKFDILDKTDYRKARANTGLSKFISDIEDWKCREKAAKEIDEAEAQRKRNIIWKAEFITFDQLKEFPIDGQVAYINNLIRKYDVSIASIASCLFQINQTSLRRHFQRCGVYDQIDRSKACHGSVGQENVDAFTKIVNEWRGTPIVEEAQTVVETEETLPAEEPENNVLVPSIISGAFGESTSEPNDISAGTEQETPAPITSFIDQLQESVTSVAVEANDKLNEIGESLGSLFTAKEPVTELVQEPAMTPQEILFSVNYISDDGLDEKQLFTLMNLFAGKKIKVSINIKSV